MSFQKGKDMKKFIDLIEDEVKRAFEKAGYDGELGRVTVSNRPDLCEYQCNGAMAGAKKYKKAPKMIADEVAALLKDSSVFGVAEAVAPGFLNLNVSDGFLVKYLKEMSEDKGLGIPVPEKPETIIVDYGGPNVAKPLHVGHLRSAVIGESVKRICTRMGHKAIGDIHLGDWGLQMGLVIAELKERKPGLSYFDESFTGEYPKEPPVTVADLEEIYPFASAKSKQDAEFKEKAMQYTYRLQNGERGIRALWKHIIDISVKDMKRNYDRIAVNFELWNGESTVQDIIPDMVQYMKDNNYTYLSEGAWVIDVKEDTDTKEMPPCILIKSDGASLYNTTDLATIKAREEEYHPDRLIYLTDKRQDLYFEQVFRAARKTHLISDASDLVHIGFGTVNGKDGKPFKTRDGGVMRLEMLIDEINEKTYERMLESKKMPEKEAEKTACVVALAALKYGDLSNQAQKDYIFDIDKFTAFEGNTGPYILYTIVRIKSILKKLKEEGFDISSCAFGGCYSEAEKALMLEDIKFNAVMESAYTELAPHRICAYIYDIANAFNRFYHETRIASEKNFEKKSNWVALLLLTRDILLECIEVLGFEAPEQM